jgi:hypothetical protein
MFGAIIPPSAECRDILRKVCAVASKNISGRPEWRREGAGSAGSKPAPFAEKKNAKDAAPASFNRAWVQSDAAQMDSPLLASCMHFGLALRPLKAACIFAGSNAENT